MRFVDVEREKPVEWPRQEGEQPAAVFVEGQRVWLSIHDVWLCKDCGKPSCRRKDAKIPICDCDNPTWEIINMLTGLVRDA